MFSLVEQVLQHDVTAPIQILRNTLVYVMSQHGRMEVIVHMLHIPALTWK